MNDHQKTQHAPDESRRAGPLLTPAEFHLRISGTVEPAAEMADAFATIAGELPARRRLSVARLVVVLGFAAVIAYFTLRASPRLAEIPWLPNWLGVWADHYSVARNAVAFGVFALVAGLLVSAGRERRCIVSGVAVMSVAAELAQLWIPTRFCDIKDIAAGLGGVLAAALVLWTFSAIGRALSNSWESYDSSDGEVES